VPQKQIIMQKFNRPLLNICLSLASLLVGLFLCEAIVRKGNFSSTWQGKKNTLKYQQLIAKYIPNYQTIGYTFTPSSRFKDIFNHWYHINNIGFRDANPKDSTSFAFIGDSVMEGFGVTNAQTAFQQFKAQFPYSQNFSVQGYSSLDALATLQNHVLQHNPHTVIWQICYNDLAHNLAILNATQATSTFATKKSPNTLKAFFQNHSALYLLLAEKYNAFLLKNGKEDHFTKTQLNTEKKAFTTLFELILQAKKQCDTHNINLQILYTPYSSEIVNKTDTYGLLISQKIKQFCKEQNLRYLDFTAYARKQYHTKPLPYYIDHCHLNTKGNKVLANFLNQSFPR